MQKIIFLLISLYVSVGLSAQITGLNEEVVTIPIVEGKVAFIKEIPLPSGNSRTQAFEKISRWASDSYGRDPFVSSVRVDKEDLEIVAKSRIELLLPVDSNGKRERFVMRYRINSFVTEDNKCILEVVDIALLYQANKGDAKAKKIPRLLRAENFISDQAINIDDDLSEIRLNTKKSTLYFINQLFKNFEVALGYVY